MPNTLSHIKNTPRLDATLLRDYVDKPSIRGNFIIMEHWKNRSLENIVEVVDGVEYTEQWLPILGYEGKYEISSFGRVKSLRYKRQDVAAILKQSCLYKHRNGIGYLRVNLTVKYNHSAVHRLVANAFIPNPLNKPQVNHKLGITTDNRVHQLEWADSSEQQIHAQKVLGFKPKIEHLKYWSEKSRQPVNQIDPITGVVVNTFASQQEACRHFKLQKDAIWRAIKYSRLAVGYKWEKYEKIK